MDKRRFSKATLWMVIYILSTAISSSFVLADQPISTSNAISLLYNPGPQYLAVRVLTVDTGSTKTISGPGTTLIEASRVGNPAGGCPEGYPGNAGIEITPAANGACASYYIDTRAGWHISDYGKEPGWKDEIIGGGNGQPIIQHYVNHASLAKDPCTLREIGTIYQESHGADSHFRVNPDSSPIRMGQFKRLVGTFVAAVDQTTLKTARCKKTPSAYVTADLRIGYPRRDDPTIIENRQILGVIVYGMRDLALNGTQSRAVTFWHGWIHGDTVEGRLIHGNLLSRIDREITPPILTDKFQRIAVDYKALFKKLFLPPEGRSLDEAIIFGFDVYSSVRGADLDFSVKQIDVIGYK